MLKKLLKSVRDFKTVSILTPVFMAMEVFMEIAIPFLLSILIDNGIANGDTKQIAIIGAMLIIAATLSLVFGVSSGKLAAKASIDSAEARNPASKMTRSVFKCPPHLAKSSFFVCYEW